MMVRASTASTFSPFSSSFFFICSELLHCCCHVLFSHGTRMGTFRLFCYSDYLFHYLLYFFCFPDDFCVLLSVSPVTTRCFYGNGKLYKHHWIDPLLCALKKKRHLIKHRYWFFLNLHLQMTLGDWQAQTDNWFDLKWQWNRWKPVSNKCLFNCKLSSIWSPLHLINPSPEWPNVITLHTWNFQ